MNAVSPLAVAVEATKVTKETQKDTKTGVVSGNRALLRVLADCLGVLGDLNSKRPMQEPPQ